jgi:putative Mn2+ efflux pump MntP
LFAWFNQFETTRYAKMDTLFLLGLALSLDSFRVSLALGAMKLRRVRQAQIAIAFGLCDGLAPLVGLLIGQSLVKYTDPWVEHLGPLVLCAYGAYVVWMARRYAGKQAHEESHWMVLGLPLSMSLDNLIAGTSLGMIGFPLLLSVVVIGAMSTLMSLAGLWLGSTAVNYLKVRTELLGGVALILIALTLALDKF